MIQGIARLKKFGIFEDYTQVNGLQPFVKYNLFYGWNGSGKSTLARVFLSLSDRKMHENFPSSELSVQISDCPDITHENINAANHNIKVFNKDFIERNVNFEQSRANSILILSEEKKDEMERYKQKLADLNAKSSQKDILNTKKEKAEEELKKNLSKWAGSIKRSFELIETSNNYYLFYDRTKLTKFIATNKHKIEASAILSPEEVKNLKNAIKPNKKPDILVSIYQPFDKSDFIEKLPSITKSLSSIALSQKITRLVENPELNSWVQEGLILHTEQGGHNCEFCGQEMPEERLNQLNAHFSEEYSIFMAELETHGEYVLQRFLTLQIVAIDSINFYEEFHAEYNKHRKELESKAADLVNIIVELRTKLDEKKSNPFNSISYEIDGKYLTLIDEYNDAISKVQSVIAKHNKKNEGFEGAIQKAQYDLELNFVSDVLIRENYKETQKAIEEMRAQLVTANSDVEDLNSEIQRLEAVLLNETIGANDFNRNLESFIGRQELVLEFDKAQKGYKLIRKGKVEPARNLSEGEKTAIAFVYFIAKLKESGNRIENTIIVVDDPISSFDSNHLFHSYSYLKKECEKALQLFVLTHNFNYYKLVRDWLLKKNERKKQKDGTYLELTRSHFYTVECSIGEPRKATISNANNTLLKFNSEYHYLFYKLFTFRDTTELNLEQAFLIANLSRRLLESFLSFKFPKGRNDFNQLLEAGCSDSEMREKVYRFINKYSHNQLIEIGDGAIDNLLGESSNIVNSVLRIVEELDGSHYREMQEVCIL